MRRGGWVAVAVGIALLLPAPARAQNSKKHVGKTPAKGTSSQGSSQNITNQVGNIGNASGTTAAGTRGNVNQNTNQSNTGVQVGGVQIVQPNAVSPGGQGPGAPAGDPYAGPITSNFASPSITIGDPSGGGTVQSDPNPIIQIPGFLGVPANFTQPYKSEGWLSSPTIIVPNRLTYEQARKCAASHGEEEWEGSSAPATKEMTLLYPSLGQQVQKLETAAQYVGTLRVKAPDPETSFIGAVCKAAIRAMEKGVNKAVVNWVHIPTNKSVGVGIGASIGFSGLPGTMGGNPYALAGAAGPSLGWAQAYVAADLVVQLTGLRDETTLSKASLAVGPPKVAAATAAPAGEVPPTPGAAPRKGEPVQGSQPILPLPPESSTR